jgi:hypothetical protein
MVREFRILELRPRNCYSPRQPGLLDGELSGGSLEKAKLMIHSSNPARAVLSMATALVVIAGLGAILLNHRVFAQTSSAPAPATSPDANAEIAALKKDLEMLKGKVPDQSHVMKDVAYHFTNLWFAGQRQNWPLAGFYCDETRAHLKWAVRVIPVRKIKAGELDLRPMLDGIDQAFFVPLQKTIEAKNLDDFSKAYRQTLDGCYSCHAAAEKPFLRLKVPEQPEARIIEFTPAG